MKSRILASLDHLEDDEQVRIFYACESGSRAWGFASRDSDYDVRFLYVHHPNWYLSVDLEHKRNVIERPIVERLDVNGWDLRKALLLLRKSNPPLLEWLGSPIVYRDQYDIADVMRELLPEAYSPVACLHHYLHMAQGNLREYLQGETVWTKKYFYVLRPVLAIRWIERGYGVAPTEFGKLVDRVVEDATLRREIERLMERKRSGEEMDRGPRVPVISDFVEGEIARLEHAHFGKKDDMVSVESLNDVFRLALHRVWEGGGYAA